MEFKVVALDFAFEPTRKSKNTTSATQRQSWILEYLEYSEEEEEGGRLLTAQANTRESYAWGMQQRATGGHMGGHWGHMGGEKAERHIGWLGWRHMQLVEMRGCGIITPDQESGTRVGLHKVTVNSSRVAQGMLVLGREGQLHNTT